MFALAPLTDRNEDAVASAPGFHIVLRFSCAVVFSNWILYEGTSEEPELLREITMPLKEASVNVHVTDLHKQVPELIDADLMECCLMWEEACLKLVDFAMKKASEAVELVPPNRNEVLYLDICISSVHKHVYVERGDPMDWVIQHSMDVDEVHMVPAEDSSIESLEKKKVLTMEFETCSICLDEFPGSCETVSMPCSHFFHEDCIKKWLRTSHYCPICRFEMPTS
ncbi:SCF ubiquitin ligase, Rbx1 component [Handroanthus impetiginosus]|uniref:RING-type E3 ubiquitin transferase n=1 Tax=Handroanthus impetiginosus TaxID=429701 RepID=A0A2G9GGD9_9LAMI|nr:SCF ubiquitin ligase, Rbx1 component [Handroanthus impetiginosus]